MGRCNLREIGRTEEKCKKEEWPAVIPQAEVWIAEIIMHWQECRRIDEYDKVQKSKRLFDQVKKVKSNAFTPKQMAIYSSTGITLTNLTEILSRWKEYGEELFHKNDNVSKIQTIDFNGIDKEPSQPLSEVVRAFRDLHSGKAPGLDIIHAELAKASGPTAVNVLHMLCVKIWDTGIWPQEWKQQELVMLNKNGNNEECGNYQTIALINHTSKILLRIILNRLQKKITEELPEEQAGFQKGQATAELICALQIMIEKLIKTKETAFVTFIDYSKAFDNVCHN